MTAARTRRENIYRSLDLQEIVDGMIQAMEADLNANGFATVEIHDAIEEVLASRRVSLAEDPDPADDPE